MTWPAYSPDQNIIEKVRLTRKVYEKEKQYEDKETFKAAIKLDWNDISLNYI